MNTPRPQTATDSAAMAAPGPVSLHIERLVLDGFSLNAAQSVQVQHALERELARLAADLRGGAVWRTGVVQTAPASAVHVAGPLRPAQLGREVARSLFSSLRLEP